MNSVYIYIYTFILDHHSTDHTNRILHDEKDLTLYKHDTPPHLTKRTNDTSQTEDLDVDIVVVILVPGCMIIACLLLIIVLLIISLVRMFKKRMMRIVPLSELSQT